MPAPQTETIGDKGDEDDDHQQYSTHSDDEEEIDDEALEEPTTVRKYRLIDLPMELEHWDEIINILERRGAKRAASTPVPEGLLSLD